MYFLDTAKFRKKVRELGFRSFNDLASHLGLHRNTLLTYFSGKRLFKKGFEQMMESLGLDPIEYLALNEESGRIDKLMAKFIDDLSRYFPEVTFVSFGSRAKGSAYSYSDWDIGVYSAGGLSHQQYLKIRNSAKELEDQLPIFVDVVNLSRASRSFLSQVANSWVFLTGKQRAWLELQEKATCENKRKAD